MTGSRKKLRDAALWRLDESIGRAELVASYDPPSDARSPQTEVVFHGASFDPQHGCLRLRTLTEVIAFRSRHHTFVTSRTAAAPAAAACGS